MYEDRKRNGKVGRKEEGYVTAAYQFHLLLSASKLEYDIFLTKHLHSLCMKNVELNES